MKNQIEKRDHMIAAFKYMGEDLFASDANARLRESLLISLLMFAADHEDECEFKIEIRKDLANYFLTLLAEGFILGKQLKNGLSYRQKIEFKKIYTILIETKERVCSIFRMALDDEDAVKGAIEDLLNSCALAAEEIEKITEEEQRGINEYTD